MATAILRNPQDFITCPDTGQNLNKPVISLAKANIFTAVVFLLAGGALGLLVALTRWPAIHILPSELFYIALTGHGAAVLLFWCHFFEVGVAYYFVTSPINARLATPKLAWFSFWLMLIGAAMATVMVLIGQATVMFSAYPPLKAHPLFYLGVILFAVGALIPMFIIMATLIKAKNERTYKGSMPLATFGILVYAIIAIFTWVMGAVIMIPTLLWSMGLIHNMDAQMYRVVFWALAHSTQQMNIVVHITIWYTLAAVLFGARPLNEKVSRMAFVLYLFALQLGSVHHLLSDPGSSFAWRTFNTSYAGYLAVLGSLIHGLTVPGGIELAQRRRGLSHGLFEWLRKAPWANPVFSGFFLSLVLFGFLGGITGVTMSNQQINMIIHNTAYVPGHFHGTVATGTTLAFFAFSYWIVPLLTRHKLAFPGLARMSTYLFGLGMGTFAVFFMAAGHLGVPRRHWDITYADASLPFQFSATVQMLVTVAEIGAVIGGTGALFYLISILATFMGKTVEKGVLSPLAEPAGVVAARLHGGTEPHIKGLEVPGSLVLCLTLLTFLIVYYFAQYKYLATIWGIH
ncbi:MAG: b(o/a)3-type cytochrome-c oxidase subunit 1 [Zetaproteobacteria bacterium]|nr:MAG: b(o/a)3-type cytochrome-c oxidase subunit 1 [Zetaproteobacteria bacterium]